MNSTLKQPHRYKKTMTKPTLRLKQHYISTYLLKWQNKKLS